MICPNCNKNGFNGQKCSICGYTIPYVPEHPWLFVPSSNSWKVAHEDFINASNTKFAIEWGNNKCGSITKVNIKDNKTKYLRLGYQQNPRKVEMAKIGAETTKKRGPACDVRLAR